MLPRSTLFEVSFSMLEIYNENVQDLLIPGANKIKGGMKIRQHPKKGFYVEDLRVVPVANFEEIESRIEEVSRKAYAYIRSCCWCC